MTPVAIRRISLIAAAVIFVALVAWHAWWATRGWHIPGMSGHEFRQAQTAVSIRAMKTDGFRLDYSTPILGKPWSIPFEFPIYEGLATLVSDTFGLDVVMAGRWVSLLAFYAALPALFLLMRTIGLSPVAAALGTAPAVFVPAFILYSRAVLIESTAMSSAVWFLYFLVRYRLERRPWLFAATFLCGVVAVLTKSTTWAVFCVPWALWGLWDLWRARGQGWRAWRVIAEDALLLGLPLLFVGYSWVWISDQIKELNPVGAFLTSDRLRAFNFGTWAQRFDKSVWLALWQHGTTAVMPWWSLAAALVGACFVPARSRFVFVLAALGFLVGPTIFINLYAIHDYYFYATAVFACIAAGVVIGGLWDGGAERWWRRGLALLVAGIVCYGGFATYRRDFYTIQVAYNIGRFGLTEAIKRLTKPEDVIVVHAPDWSSIVAFRSERRTLMIPDSQMYYRAEAVERGIALLRDENVPLVVFWGESRKHVDWTLQRIRDFQLQLFPLFTWENEATVYAARSVYQQYREVVERDMSGRDGVTLDPLTKIENLVPAVPLAGTPLVEGMSNLDPVPVSGSLPYGVDYRYIDGVKYLFAHAPTELFFDLPPNASRVEIGYRMDAGVYGKPGFDGVYVVVEAREQGKRPEVLHEEWLTPDGSRAPRHKVFLLKGNNRGQLVVRFLPGPANSNAYDWSLLEYLRIR